MWEVSTRFLTALGKPHRRVTQVTLRPYGGAPVPLDLKAGTVRVVEGRTVRRTCRLQVLGAPARFAELVADGAALTVEHGLRYGNTTELVPVFAGEVVQAGRPFGDVQAAIVANDYGHQLSEARFVTPYSATGSPTRQVAIADLVEGGRAGTTVITETTATSTVGDAVWERSRTEAIADIARDGNLDAFHLPDGSFIIRDSKTVTSPADYTVRGGPGGTLTDGERVRPLERRYNAVVVTPASVGQDWPAQVAQVTDTANPRHPDRIGLRPYFMTLPTITTAAQALAVAQVALDRIVGTSESLAFGAVSNPALEAGDVVRVVVPSLNGEAAVIYQHFVTAYALDLRTGAMTAETRSQRVTDD